MHIGEAVLDLVGLFLSLFSACIPCVAMSVETAAFQRAWERLLSWGSVILMYSVVSWVLEKFAAVCSLV